MTGDCHVRFCERLRGETPLCLLGERKKNIWRPVFLRGRLQSRQDAKYAAAEGRQDLISQTTNGQPHSLVVISTKNRLVVVLKTSRPGSILIAFSAAPPIAYFSDIDKTPMAVSISTRKP